MEGKGSFGSFVGDMGSIESIEVPYEFVDSQKQEIDCRFSYHAPKGNQVAVYQQLRDKAKELAELYIECVPSSREREYALASLEESNMWANAGIARRG